MGQIYFFAQPKFVPRCKCCGNRLRDAYTEGVLIALPCEKCKLRLLVLTYPRFSTRWEDESDAVQNVS